MLDGIDFWAMGRLMRVERWMTDFADAEGGRDWLVGVEFVFERAAVMVEAVPDDDTISVHLSMGLLNHWSTGSIRTSTTSRAAGHTVRWAWLLTNHLGLLDGFQIEFASDLPTVCLQFVTVASRLVELEVVAVPAAHP